MIDYLVSVDLGQSQDPTAIIVAQRVEQLEGEYDRKRGRWPTTSRYEVPHIDRPPLGTGYPVIVERVAGLLDRLKRKSPDRVTLIVDSTGVGRPVVEMMIVRGLNPLPVVITGGQNPSVTQRALHIPKKVLVSTLAILLGNKRILVSPQLPLAALLVQELQAFRMKMSKIGNESFEAWREGDHDDLVLAMCMLAWVGENRLASILPQPPAPRLPLPEVKPLSFDQHMRLARRKATGVARL